MRRPAAWALPALLLLAACAGSGRKPYDEAGAAKNLAIRTASSARASLDVHRVDARCATHYLGTVRLDKPAVELGIPAGQPAWLEFVFETSSFLAARRTESSHGTLLLPAPGARYEIDVTYRDDIYGVVVHETRGRGPKRELPRRALDACR
jgi:hypothetical protein